MTQHNEDHLQPDFTDKLQTFDEGVDNILRILEEAHEILLENSRKLDAIMEHLKVPYKPLTPLGPPKALGG